MANQGSTVSKKNRKLTCSASIPELQKPTSMTPQNGYLSMKNQPMDGRATVEEENKAQPEIPNQLTNDQKNSSQELAKIQPTSALTIDLDKLVGKCENQPRTELVTKFVDFSSKYGLGYMLSNGSYGVLFNDSTKIILHSNLFHFDYIERSKHQPPINSNG